MESERLKISGQVAISTEKVEEIKKEVKNIPDLKIKVEQVLAENATGILAVTLTGAVSLDSSDIHIEPEEEQAKLRIRMDGLLHDVMELDLKIFKTLLSRIKLLSGLKLNISNRPQDG